MTSWGEFKTAAESFDADGWTVRQGEALYTDGDIVATVRIKVGPNSLNPEGIRASLVDVMEVDFEGEATGSDGDVYFWFRDHVWWPLWLEAYHEDPPDLYFIPSFPDGHRKPLTRDFTTAQLDDFHLRRTMSGTPVAPLWGQHRNYFWEPVVEFDTGPLQEHDGDIRRIFRQDWLLKIPPCPFCNLDPINSVLVYALRPPDQLVYSGDYYIMACPRCERAMDALKVETVEKIMEERG